MRFSTDLSKCIVSLILTLLTAVYLFFGLIISDSTNADALVISNENVDVKEEFSTNIESNIGMYEQFINEVCGFENKTVNEVKILEDFNGELYIDIECSPTGYAIVNYQYGIILEMAVDAVSPYKNFEGELIYGGPTYYYKEVSTFLNTSNIFNLYDLMADELISLDVDQFNEFQTYNDAILEKTTEIYEEETVAITPSPRSVLEAYIENYQYISQLENFGENIEGTCGYIAAAIVLYYNYMQFDTRFIDSEHLCPEGGIKDSLHQELRSIGQSLGIGNSTWAADIAAVMEEYTENRVPEATHYYMALSTSLNIDLCFADNKPVILFGNFQLPTGGSGKHAVVAYGYRQHTELWFNTRYYYVHFGWEGYGMVQLLDNVFTNPIGSMYNMNPEG